jgi:hypothetical protein
MTAHIPHRGIIEGKEEICRRIELVQVMGEDIFSLTPKTFSECGPIGDPVAEGRRHVFRHDRHPGFRLADRALARSDDNSLLDGPRRDGDKQGEGETGRQSSSCPISK